MLYYNFYIIMYQSVISIFLVFVIFSMFWSKFLYSFPQACRWKRHRPVSVPVGGVRQRGPERFRDSRNCCSSVFRVQVLFCFSYRSRILNVNVLFFKWFEHLIVNLFCRDLSELFVNSFNIFTQIGEPPVQHRVLLYRSRPECTSQLALEGKKHFESTHTYSHLTLFM